MKKTTKLTALVLALVLTLALALTGCGKKTTTIQIAVPNDTTNEARALLLLQAAGHHQAEGWRRHHRHQERHRGKPLQCGDRGG